MSHLVGQCGRVWSSGEIVMIDTGGVIPFVGIRVVVAHVAESRFHVFLKISQGKSMTTPRSIDAQLPFLVTGGTQMPIGWVFDVSLQPDGAQFAFSVPVVHLHHINIQQFGEKLVDGRHLGVLTPSSAQLQIQRGISCAYGR